MKKKILSAAVAAAALFGAYTAQQANEVAMSDLLSDDVEALAQMPEGASSSSSSTNGEGKLWRKDKVYAWIGKAQNRYGEMEEAHFEAWDCFEDPAGPLDRCYPETIVIF